MQMRNKREFERWVLLQMPLRQDLEGQRLEKREDTRYQSFNVKGCSNLPLIPTFLPNAFHVHDNEVSYRRVLYVLWGVVGIDFQLGTANTYVQ